MERARGSGGYDGYEPFHGYELEVPNEQDSERKLCWREYVVQSAMMAMTPSMARNPQVVRNPLVDMLPLVAVSRCVGYDPYHPFHGYEPSGAMGYDGYESYHGMIRR